LGHFDIKK